MSPRATSFVGKNIVVSLWLIFDRTGAVRMTRTRPNISRNERALALTVTLPQAMFTDPPTLAARITVEDPGGREPPRIDLQAASNALSGAIGCDVDLRIVTAMGGERHDAR